MHIHCDGVELFQTLKMTDEEYDQTSSFNCLDRSTKDVWSQSFEILEDQHLVSASKHFMGLIIVSIPDLSGRDEKIKRIIYVLIIKSLHLFVLCLFHSFFLVARKLQFFVITPEDIWPVVHGLASEDIVEVNNLIASTVSYQEKDCAVMLFNIIFDEGLNPTVDLLFHIVDQMDL